MFADRCELADGVIEENVHDARLGATEGAVEDCGSTAVPKSQDQVRLEVLVGVRCRIETAHMDATEEEHAVAEDSKAPIRFTADAVLTLERRIEGNFAVLVEHGVRSHEDLVASSSKACEAVPTPLGQSTVGIRSDLQAVVGNSTAADRLESTRVVIEAGQECRLWLSPSNLRRSHSQVGR